jgi:hypothetical protein
LNDQAATPLVPPRPNLGPEPLTDAGTFNPGFLAVLTAVLTIAAVLAWRRLSRKRRPTTRSHGGPAASGGPPSARDRLIALSPTIRSALVSRFGPSCLARTTEELASDPRIGEVLGRVDFDRLIEILNAIDRLKFSAPLLIDDEASLLTSRLKDWEPSVLNLTKALAIGRNGKIPDQEPVPASVPNLGGRRRRIVR